jgi:uncharacterized protein (TIGR02118 family)
MISENKGVKDMTIKLIAIYRRPENEFAFNKHYEEIHTPLVLNIPGLQSLTVNRIKKHVMGEDQPYMIVEMAYADRAAFDTAMASEENKATGKDVMTFAKGIVSLVMAES